MRSFILRPTGCKVLLIMRTPMGRSGQKLALIVEDDRHTADLLRVYLEREGFDVLTAGDGEAGAALAERRTPDIVILDLMLPKLDGWEVCRRLRRKSDVPVVMLTARGEEVDKVSGLTLGADDYVVKPFSPRELVARVHAVLRRTSRPDASRKPRLSMGELRLDMDKHRLSVSGRVIAVTPHEFTLLQALMSAPGRSFTREELLQKLYPMGEATVIERVVDVHIGKLRQKIEKNPSDPKYVLTVRGIGYRFAEPAENREHSG
jgi:DNA-binding response OmpR family regulator